MDNDLPPETGFSHPLNYTAGYLRDRGIRHTEPKHIGLQPGSIESGKRQSARASCGGSCRTPTVHDHLLQLYSPGHESVSQ